LSFPNVTDLVATTIEYRQGEIRDNVTKNNAFLRHLEKKGNTREFSGGTQIFEEISFQANPNAAWYSGYDPLPTSAADVISAAAYQIKQAACPVTVSGLELLQNAGKEKIIDLVEGRMKVAEASMYNLLAQGAYADGTANSGKQIGGLDAAIPVTPSTGTYGNINRATWPFWQSQVRTASATITAATVQTEMNAMWALLVRGKDHPHIAIMDSFWWQTWQASLQAIQRFTSSEVGDLGFPTSKYMNTDTVLDGGIGGFATFKTCYWINTDFFYWRPHSARNMVPLSPEKRYAINQDAVVQILAWAGNITSAGPQFCGRSISP
jgi:hypothetical protein